MRRGDVYMVRLAPTEGSEQAGTRPAVIITRDAINRSSPVVMISPLTDAARVQRLYPSHVLVKAPEGGLTKDSVVLTEQSRAVATSRLLRHLGRLSTTTMQQVDAALKTTLDLP